MLIEREKEMFDVLVEDGFGLKMKFRVKTAETKKEAMIQAMRKFRRLNFERADLTLMATARTVR